MKDAFRGAGLSHVLVVSGLHLSAVGGLVYAAVRRMGAAQAGLRLRHVFLSGFMCLTGLHPLLCARGYGNAAALRGALCLTGKATRSLRWAWRHCFVPAEPICCRGCKPAPFVLGHVGGALGDGGAQALARRQRGAGKNAARLGWKLLWTAAVPAATSLTTLPVLIAIGGGVSLLSVVKQSACSACYAGCRGPRLCSGAVFGRALARFSGKADGSGLRAAFALDAGRSGMDGVRAVCVSACERGLCHARLFCFVRLAGQPGICMSLYGGRCPLVWRL